MKIASLGIILTLCAGNALCAELPDTVERIRPAIVAIGVHKPTGSPPFVLRGTGFGIGDGNTIATNAHVVSGATAGDEGSRLVAQLRVGNSPETQLRGLHLVSLDKDHDLAILRLDGPALPVLKLGNSETVREGQEIAFTGFPIGTVLGFSPSTHRGIVAAITPIALPAPNAKQLNAQRIRQAKSENFPIFQLDAVAYPGNSGSPVFNPQTGEVIGVINMVFIKASRETSLSQPSGISYAIPARHLQNLLPHANPQ